MGSRCEGGFEKCPLASAMNAWFAHKDLTSTRQWFRESARLQRMVSDLDPESGIGGWCSRLLAPLVANDADMIEWFATARFPFDPEQCNDPNTYDFFHYQARLAARGDWALLESRCTEFLASPAQTEEFQKYVVDNQFYLALAQRDEASMLQAVKQLLEPDALKAREDDEGGYTRDLISTMGVIYTKLAWRNGFKIDPGSSIVPSEWLPLDPAPLRPSPYGV
jgi:Immunity protein 49